ncbi:MAG: Serine/threonine protein kinase PrkC, regulator of stationary phase [Pseudonocardiales bacterium]|jgi:beta-lactam-binding protein with PASTA domain/tRNA A-37 threonylcarbamoyl transferase component Bud32|nr:Serine/threonine protein kinase PrkC, regulator of stationary phase [Pseudonocardiales bacterium]
MMEPGPGPTTARITNKDRNGAGMTIPRLLSDRYELGETLGYGGMSEVHLGRDMRLDRDVAVKVLRADLARDPQFQHRFRREAQNAAALNHPAIVAVYDTGETVSDYGPLPYIVMEYVEGRTLRDIVKTEGPMDEQRAMETMADICAALDFSHRNGIIHRDVKPANVMINNAGAVKVMDFGIARALADGQGVTQTAAVVGTAQYLSPEQARGELVDARSDVYAAGCVLYELITGEPPFTGDSPVAVAYQHVREDPIPPSRQNPDVSAALDAVVLKAMSKNPANRYQSAAEMRTDLVRVLSGQRQLAPVIMTDADRDLMLDSGPTVAIRPIRPTRASRRHADPAGASVEERRPARGLGILTTVVIIAIVGLLLLLFTDVFGGGPKPISLPNVVGQPVPSAEQALNAAGFQTERHPVESTPQDLDRVVAMNPVGQAVRGTTVRLDVGAGPAEVEVPNLLGLDRVQAQASLQQVGLMLSPDQGTQVAQDDKDINRVLVQDPAAGGRLAKGKAVAITVGVAPETVGVPDVVGTNIDQAQRNIVVAHLTAAVQDVDSTAPKGQVLRQSPGGGNTVKAGSTVTLTVSRGNQIQMPDLRGQTPTQAQNALRKLGWTGTLKQVFTPVEDAAQVGLIVAQDVPAGTGFARDQTITITVGQNNEATSTTTTSGIFGGTTGFPSPGG